METDYHLLFGTEAATRKSRTNSVSSAASSVFFDDQSQDIENVHSTLHTNPHSPPSRPARHNSTTSMTSTAESGKRRGFFDTCFRRPPPQRHAHGSLVSSSMSQTSGGRGGREHAGGGFQDHHGFYDVLFGEGKNTPPLIRSGAPWMNYSRRTLRYDDAHTSSLRPPRD